MVTRFSIVEATIDDLSKALASGTVTSVELVTIYLNRIAYYDRRGIRLNSTPVLNPGALEEAIECDKLRAAGLTKGPLHGIPFAIKDSYKARGLTVAAGSPAFAELVATDDSFAVAALRQAGAIVLGKTNMPPMAIGGLQRGLYGRAESPYNPDYLAAAWHSGSSSGSGVAVAANLCAFGLAEETVSSGRSPASNNGLVAYTPSRGMISIRGNWPLFPLRDIVVPYTRSVKDMLHVLNALVVEDPDKRGDLWRTQDVIKLPKITDVMPTDFLNLGRTGSLAGCRLGVPKMYIGKDTEATSQIHVRPSISALWEEARVVLTSLGATIVEVDFPVVSAYESDRPGMSDLYDRNMLPSGWNDIEINDMVSAAWEEFLQLNADPNLSTLADIDPSVIHADPPEAVDTRRDTKPHPGRDSIDYQRIVKRVRQGAAGPLSFPQLPAVLNGLERARKELFEQWMQEEDLSAVIFPANSDIAPSNADTDPISSATAWRNGVVFSNTNHVMRHLGIPSTTVPMGILPDIGMPVGLTFMGAAYSDEMLLRYAFDYETASQKRSPPTYAPSRDCDMLPLLSPPVKQRYSQVYSSYSLEVHAEAALKFSGSALLELNASVQILDKHYRGPGLEMFIFVDGMKIEHVEGKAIIEIAAEDRRRARLASSVVLVIAQDKETGWVNAKHLEVRYKM